MINEIRDGWSHFIDRLKSPFGGTFIFIWIITHWEFVYYLIFVSSDVIAEERIVNIKFYFQGSLTKRFILDVLQPAFLTFIAIAIYHSFSIVAGVITGTFKRHLEPRISNQLGTGSVVLKSDFDEELKKRSRIESEFTELENKRNFEYTKFSQREAELDANIKSLTLHISNLERQKSELEYKIKLALGHNIEVITFLTLERIKELMFLKFVQQSDTGFLGIMQEKRHLYTFENSETEPKHEKFKIDEQGFYIVEEYNNYFIKNIYYNPDIRQIYFEKFDIDGKLKFIDHIYYNNRNFIGYEIDFERQARYKIIYSNISLKTFDKIN